MECSVVGRVIIKIITATSQFWGCGGFDGHFNIRKLVTRIYNAGPQNTKKKQRRYLNAVFFHAVPHVFQEGKHAVDMR